MVQEDVVYRFWYEIDQFLILGEIGIIKYYYLLLNANLEDRIE